MGTPFYSYSVRELYGAGTLADAYAAPSTQRPNDITSINSSVINVATVAIAPALPTAGDLNTTIRAAQSRSEDSIRLNGQQDTGIYVSLLETLDDAGDLSSFMIRPNPLFWFGNIQIVMNGLTDAQRTTITNLDIGSQISVTKTFPKSTPSTVTQLMALEGISHDISPDRHIVTLYTNPARIYTYFIVGGYPLTTRTNLLTNPSIETNTTGWTPNALTLARSSTFAYSGTYSLQGTVSSTGVNRYIDTSATGLGSTTYSYSCWVYLPATNTADTTWSLIFYEWNGTAYTVGTTLETKTVTRGVWTRFSGSVTTIASTVLVQPRIINTASMAAGQVIYLDGALLETGSTVNGYFDGANADTYTGFALNSKAWTGTANASTSVGTWYQGATRTNLVPNPNFEVDVLMTENTSPGGSTLARSTAQFYSGTASCAGSTTGTGGNLIFGTMSSSSRIAATAGTVYTGSLYARSAAVQRTTYARLLFRDAGGTVLSTTNGTSSATSTTAWTRYTVTETAPANTATVTLQVVVLGVSTTETHYIDGLLLETGSSALPYFDGTYADTYTGYTLTSQAWSGTANASTSTANWGLTSAFIGSQIGDDTKGLG